MPFRSERRPREIGLFPGTSRYYDRTLRQGIYKWLLIQRSAIPRRRGLGHVQKDDRSAHNLRPRGSPLASASASASDTAQPGWTYHMLPFLKLDFCKFMFDP